MTLLGAALAAEAKHGVTLPAELIESCESVYEIDDWVYIIAAHRGPDW